MNDPFALIIEDDPKLGAIYETIVQQAGYIAEIISTGDKAMQQLDVASPDLILLDIHLPHVSGVDILQRIRSDTRLAHIPVIVVTADQRIPQSIEKQANYVLMKSLGISQLRNLITQLRHSHQPDTTELLQNPGETL